MTSVEAVVAERRRRGWSVRTAAIAGGVSNTTWGTFERTGAITPAVQRAVVTAYGWPADWWDNPPAQAGPHPGEVAELRSLVAEMAAQQTEVAAQVAALQAELAELRASSRREDLG